MVRYHQVIFRWSLVFTQLKLKFGFYFKSTPCFFLEIYLNSCLIRLDQLSHGVYRQSSTKIYFKYLNIIFLTQSTVFSSVAQWPGRLHCTQAVWVQSSADLFFYFLFYFLFRLLLFVCRFVLFCFCFSHSFLYIGLSFLYSYCCPFIWASRQTW